MLKPPWEYHLSPPQPSFLSHLYTWLQLSFSLWLHRYSSKTSPNSKKHSSGFPSVSSVSLKPFSLDFSKEEAAFSLTKCLGSGRGKELQFAAYFQRNLEDFSLGRGNSFWSLPLQYLPWECGNICHLLVLTQPFKAVVKIESKISYVNTLYKHKMQGL